MLDWQDRDLEWFRKFAHDSLIEDIDKNGLDHPPVMMDHPRDKTTAVIEGNHRAAALIALGHKFIPVYLSEPVDEDDILFNRENPSTEGGRGQVARASGGGVNSPPEESIIPITGGTILAAAPQQQPVVPVEARPSQILPLSQVKLMAAKHNPNHKVRSVKELLIEARLRSGNTIVP